MRPACWWRPRTTLSSASHHAAGASLDSEIREFGTIVFVVEGQKRTVRPERIRIRFRDDEAGATPLELPGRRIWPFSLVFGTGFAIFAAIAWTTGADISRGSVDDVFDLMFVLFKGFWLLGWSVGVLILGALTVLFLFYGESARLQGGRLVRVPRLGPVKIIIEYDLARVRNVRVENAGGAGNQDSVRIRFDYEEGSSGLGDTMPRADG